MFSFKPTFSLYFCTFIKRLFSSFSLSAIRVVLSAYLRLLIFLPAVLIPACASSSLAFHMMYSACKLNKQGENIQGGVCVFRQKQKITHPNLNHFNMCVYLSILLQRDCYVFVKLAFIKWSTEHQMMSYDLITDHKRRQNREVYCI